jgi:hypothetical protein
MGGDGDEMSTGFNTTTLDHADASLILNPPATYRKEVIECLIVIQCGH